MAALLWGPRALPLAAAAATTHRPRRRGSSLALHGRPSALVVSAAAAAGQQQRQQQHRQRHKALSDPAKIQGASTHTIAVQDRSGELSLDAYMRLPTEQYNELDPSMIFALGGSSFLLKVPRVQLFDVWVEPEVVVDVGLVDGPPGVVFESGECRLKGSELLQRLELDKKFVLYFHTALTWEPRGSGGVGSGNGSASNGSGNGGMQSAAPAAAARGAAGGGGQGHITAKADVQVWSEVVGPFRAIPRPLLEATGNGVMGALMQALLPAFMRRLADDYVRWSTDPQYRARRAAAATRTSAMAGATAGKATGKPPTSGP